MSQIRDIVSLIERSLKEAIRTLAPLVNEVLAGLTEFWAKHGREVTTVVVDTILVALDAIETGIRAVRTTVGTVLGVMEDIWDAHGTQLKTIIRNVWSTIDGVVTTGLNNIRSLLRAATAVLEGDWDTAWSSIKTIVDRTISGIQSFLRTEGKAMLTAALTIVTDAAASVWRDLKAAVIGSGGGGGIVGDLISSVTTFISGIGTEDVRAAFRTLGSAIRNVFLGLFDIGGTAWSIVTDFVDWFVGYIGSGKAFSDFKTAVTTLLSAVESVWSDYLAPAGGRLWSIVTDLFDRFVTYVGSGEAFGDLRAAFGGLMDMIFAAFEGLYNGLIGKSMIPDMFKDIRDYVAGAGKGMLRAAFDGVRRAIERALNSIGLGGIMDALRGVAKEANNLLDTIDSIPSSIDVDWPSPPDWLNGGDNGDEDGDDEDEDDDDDDDDDDAPPRNPREGPNAGGLAEGGYVTGPTAAWVGEGSDDEFVTPASTMERILRETAREALRSAGSGGDTTIVVEEGAIHAPDADADEILDRLTRRLKYERTR
jgi:phage-related protein